MVYQESQKSWMVYWMGTKPVTDTGLKIEIIKTTGFGVKGMGHITTFPCSSRFWLHALQHQSWGTAQ